MKLMMIFVFVYALGITTLLADEAPEYNETKGSLETDFLDKPSSFSDSLEPCPQKREQDESCAGWRRVNTSPVCFGAKDNHFGRFSMPSIGRLAAIKLVHLYGYVTCAAPKPNYWSHWGCGDVSPAKDLVNVVITTATNHILFPADQLTASGDLGRGKWYHAIGYNSWSPELVLSAFSHPPHMVSSGQELRVWYGEDLRSFHESDNGGKVCCNVYALYV